MVIITLKSYRFLIISLTSASNISVSKLRSCISSRMIALYLDNNLSYIASLTKIPSVAYFISVLEEVHSSNLTEYPTS